MKVCVGEGYEGLGFSLVRVDGAHPLSVMVVAVSPRVRMVLRVGRCTELIGSRFLCMMASVFTLPHGGLLGLRGRQLYCEQGKGSKGSRGSRRSLLYCIPRMQCHRTTRAA